MKLEKKAETPHKQESKPVVKPVSYIRSAYEYIREAQIPYGKFKGREFGYIIDHEQWYLDWMEREGVLGTWGLIRMKSEPKKKSNYDPFRASDGRIWLTISIKENIHSQEK